MLGERAHRPGAEIRERADVEDGATAGQLADEPRVLSGADAVSEPVGLKRLERAANRFGSGRLARMRHRAEPQGLRKGEDLCVRLRRELRLEPPEADADDAAVAVARRPLDGRPCLVLREPARDVRGQPDLDAVQLVCLLRAVADSLEDVLPGAATADA